MTSLVCTTGWTVGSCWWAATAGCGYPSELRRESYTGHGSSEGQELVKRHVIHHSIADDVLSSDDVLSRAVESTKFQRLRLPKKKKKHPKLPDLTSVTSGA